MTFAKEGTIVLVVGTCLIFPIGIAGAPDAACFCCTMLRLLSRLRFRRVKVLQSSIGFNAACSTPDDSGRYIVGNDRKLSKAII